MKEEPVQLQAKGRKLAAVLHLPEERPDSAVICCHGLLADKNSPKQRFLAYELCWLGHLALRFDFTGRGESEGDLLQLTLARQAEDCQSAWEFLKTLGVRKFGLFGSSFGGSTAILVAARGNIDALVTLAAPARTRELFARQAGYEGLKRWEREGVISFEGVPIGYSVYRESMTVEPLALAKNVTCPWLILHGEPDEVVPFEDATALAKACRTAYLEPIKNADHRLSDQSVMRETMIRAANFLDQKLKGKQA